MEKIYYIVLAYLAVINLYTFITYAIDKHKAKKNAWRTPEWVLILLAIVGGSIGALAAMKVFRHKTQHVKFYVGVPLILVIQIAIVYLTI